mmetsp:Transcript_42575/g.90730  ORF Transcript_42575/g.90730 Transcript_42575/m.90730 type:complete len:87 (-) Transcript_42575:592-852(-)
MLLVDRRNRIALPSANNGINPSLKKSSPNKAEMPIALPQPASRIISALFNIAVSTLILKGVDFASRSGMILSSSSCEVAQIAGPVL